VSINLVGMNGAPLPLRKTMKKKEQYLEIAKATAKMSKDPSTKVGCIIVRPDGSIASLGYNGFLKKSKDSYMTYDKPMKYLLTLHAEINAVLHCSDSDISNHTMVVTHAPCFNCLMISLQSNIRSIIFESHDLTSKMNKDEHKAICKMILSTEATVSDLAGHSYAEHLMNLHGWSLDDLLD
jgi:dCMP deaminase